MHIIKKFDEFIKEGAWYDSNGKVFLSLKNHKENKKELLKTANFGGNNFNKRGLGDVKVYYGLYPDEKYQRSKEKSRETKEKIMDVLKKAEPGTFSMAPGETFEDFIKGTALKYIDGDIDYIVRIGSSADLVSVMSESLQKIYPKAKLIDLNKKKYTYKDIGKVIDVDEYLKKVKAEIEKEKKDGKPESKKSTRILIGDWMRRKLEEYENKGGQDWFHLRSSGSMGSLRSAFKPKYDTTEGDFINAVNHCLSGDKNGNYGKMILIDDNTQEGKDLKDIANKMIEIVATVVQSDRNNFIEVIKEARKKAIEKNKKYGTEIPEVLRRLDEEITNLLEIEAVQKIKENIIGYVLYNFGSDVGTRELSIEVYKRTIDKSIIKNLSEYFGKGEDEIKWKLPAGFKIKEEDFEKFVDDVTKEAVLEILRQKGGFEIDVEAKIKELDPEIIIRKLKIEPKKEEKSTLPFYVQGGLKVGNRVLNTRTNIEGTISSIDSNSFKVIINGRETLPLSLSALDPKNTNSLWKLID